MMIDEMTELKLFASKLNGRERRNEITKEEELEAKEKGFLVIFGQSDDLMEMRGIVDDEFDVNWGKPTCVFFTEKDSLQNHFRQLGNVQEETLKNILEYFNVPLLKICVEEFASRHGENNFAWYYSTDAVHATFDIFDEGDPYCKGLVIDFKGYFSELGKETA